MIRDADKLSQQIVAWLQEQAHSANRSLFVISGNPEEPAAELTIRLCKRAGHISFPTVKQPFEISSWCIQEAETNSGIIVGTLTREDIFARTYHKYGLALADIFPLGELYGSEIKQLTNIQQVEEKKFRNLPASLIEWADRENTALVASEPNGFGIITSEKPPNTSRAWFRYTIPQKEAISRLHQYDKLTKHKIINRPIFPARISEFVQR